MLSLVVLASATAQGGGVISELHPQYFNDLNLQKTSPAIKEKKPSRIITKASSSEPVVSASYKKITKEDMEGFHWSITDPPAPNPFSNSKTVGRDLNWILSNPKELAKLKENGTKVLCYFNLGRLQANPWKSEALAKKAYAGVYKHYQGFQESETCNEIGDKWGEPWISWKPENQSKALGAYQKLIQEAKGACDGLEYDNLDAAENIKDEEGNVTNACGDKKDAEKMLKKVCEMTHKAGMSCFLKNSFDIADKVAHQFDGLIGEQCFHYKGNAEKAAKAFVGKPIACMEYENTDVEEKGAYQLANFQGDCKRAQQMGLSNFWVDARQRYNGYPLPGKACSSNSETTYLIKSKTSVPGTK